MFRFLEFFRTLPGLLMGSIALFSAGAATGAAITHSLAPVAAMAPAPQVRIASLATQVRPWIGAPIVTVRGRVAEIYGNRFVIDDGSGRALIDTGAETGVVPVAINQTVTVQGRFEGGGLIRAAFLVGPDGRVASLDMHRGHGRGHHGGLQDRPDFEAAAAPAAVQHSS